MLRFTLPIALLLAITGCATSTTDALGLPELTTVETLDVERYDGVWYEIANFPMVFQEGCASTTATYGLRDDGSVDVRNACLKEDGPIEAIGVARPVDVERGKLEVSFFGPFYGAYWVVDLGEANGPNADYTHAVVSEPGRDSLWILSRTPSLDDEVLDGILDKIENDLDIPLDRLTFTDQSQPAP